MRNNRFKGISFILITVVLAVLCSCKGGGTTSVNDGGDTIKLKYAERITMVRHNGYTVVSLEDPWNKGKTLHTYVLVPKDKEMPTDLPDGTIVRTPITKAVIATSVHCGLVMQLGRSNSIKGICELRYMNIPYIQKRCREGKIIDCGNGLAPNLEKIIDSGADAIIISPFQNNGGYGRLEEWKKPIIEASDYMETSALGRAEWIKFYGMLFGEERKANSIFALIEVNYNRLMALAKKSKVRKSVIIDKKTSSVWRVPGGKSTIGRIIADANADYPFASDTNSGSLSLPFETVFEKAGDADVWLFRYNSQQPATLESLKLEYQGYAQLKSYKDKEVYGCNTATNTFYEDTPFRPDLLLRDFIIITHPDLKGLGQPKYFVKIK